MNTPSSKSRRANRSELVGSLEEDTDDQDVQNCDAQTSGSVDSTKVFGEKEWKKPTKVITQICECDKAKVMWASR